MEETQKRLYVVGENSKGERTYRFSGSSDDYRRMLSLLTHGGTIEQYRSLFPQEINSGNIGIRKRATKSFYDNSFWTSDITVLKKLAHSLVDHRYIDKAETEKFVLLLSSPMNQSQERINWMGKQIECILLLNVLREKRKYDVNNALFNQDHHTCKPMVICKLFIFNGLPSTPKKIWDLQRHINKNPNDTIADKMTGLIDSIE